VATSPWLDLTGMTNPQAVIIAWQHTEGSIYDGWNVKVSTNGSTYTAAEPLSPSYNLTISSQAAWGGDMSSAGVQPFKVDLTPWAGQQGRLQLDFGSDASVHYPGMYVDSVLVGQAGGMPLRVIAGQPENATAGRPFSFVPGLLGGGAANWSISGG